MIQVIHKFFFVLLSLFILCSFSMGNLIGGDTQDSGCIGCKMKIGDRAMLTAVMIATGPGLTVESPDLDRRVIFYNSNNNADSMQKTDNWSDLILESSIKYDEGLGGSSNAGSSDGVLCANYATICPGSYTYDKNGVRIDHPGGGDKSYRIHCCGSYAWTPTYKPSYSESE